MINYDWNQADISAKATYKWHVLYNASHCGHLMSVCPIINMTDELVIMAYLPVFSFMINKKTVGQTV
jgi:hypothetical protein